MSRKKSALEKAERAQKRNQKRQLERAKHKKKQVHDPAKWEAKKAARDKEKYESGLKK